MFEIEMFFTIKLYLHLNCVMMLNWIVWNWTVFHIETVLTLNWIVLCTHAKRMFEIELIIYIKMDLALNNLQRLICHKTQPTNHLKNELLKLTHTHTHTHTHDATIIGSDSPFQLWSTSSLVWATSLEYMSI